MEAKEEDEWLIRRLPNFSNSTFCDFQGILNAVTLFVRQRVNGVIVYDSKSTLYALSSPRISIGSVAQAIQRQLAVAIAIDGSLVMSFVGCLVTSSFLVMTRRTILPKRPVRWAWVT